MNNALDTVIQKLNARNENQPLSPKQIWNEELDREIAGLPLGKDKASITLKAGLHLLNDSLDRSHAYAQQIEDTATGAYWHGIMHRMEGDYWNGKYWFRQAGSHPVFQKVRDRVAPLLLNEELELLHDDSIKQLLQLLAGSVAWNASAFSDAVEALEQGGGTQTERNLLERVQAVELEELFNYTLQQIA
ncbi:hypothetical protein [Paenibacillus gansuensis]|uniref:Uncharacterized protein n=1 Tax=Paenibacillus gansuensis TaxID=306542 RepID=A0ABW5PKG3_9BACL